MYDLGPRHEKACSTYAKTKAQISCTGPLFSLHRRIPLYPRSTNFKPLTIFFGCTAQLVSDLVGNPIGMFSHDAAPCLCLYLTRQDDESVFIKITCLCDLFPLTTNFGVYMGVHSFLISALNIDCGHSLEPPR